VAGIPEGAGIGSPIPFGLIYPNQGKKANPRLVEPLHFRDTQDCKLVDRTRVKRLRLPLICWPISPVAFAVLLG